jgi:hypothetical protein
VDWIHLAQVSFQWQALVNMATNILVPRKIENLLISWVTISFTKKLVTYLGKSAHRTPQSRGQHSCYQLRMCRIKISVRRPGVLTFLLPPSSPFGQTPRQCPCFGQGHLRSYPSISLTSSNSIIRRHVIWETDSVRKKITNKYIKYNHLVVIMSLGITPLRKKESSRF